MAELTEPNVSQLRGAVEWLLHFYALPRAARSGEENLTAAALGLLGDDLAEKVIAAAEASAEVTELVRERDDLRDHAKTSQEKERLLIAELTALSAELGWLRPIVQRAEAVRDSWEPATGEAARILIDYILDGAR